MAYTKEEHASRLIVKTVQEGLKNNVLPRIILLCGKEEFLIHWSKNYLIDMITDPRSRQMDLNVFSEEDIEADSIIMACDTPPILSKRKLIIVEDSDILSAQSPSDMNSEEIQTLAGYLKNIPESSMLVFTCIKPNKTKALYKAISKLGIIYDFTPLDDATLGGWMAKRFNAAGKTARRSDMTDFAKFCGYGDIDREYSLYNLENDLKIIFALYDKNEISLDDMLNAVSTSPEINSFKLLDAALSGNKGEALNILHASTAMQAASKETGTLLSFLGLLISQLEIMTEGKERLEQGMDMFQITSEMGVNEYRLKKAMTACRDKTSSQLRKTLFNAFQIEKNLKSGNMDVKTGLELFITNL